MEDPATIQNFEEIVKNLLSLAIRLAGVALFVMLIIGGFKYVTSGGDPKKVQSAQNTLTYAIGGLILAILAWFILRFIYEFTGVDVAEFKIAR